MSKNNDVTRMTKADLYDWIRSYNCNQIILPEFKAHVIYFENKNTGGLAWIDLPIDNTIVRDYTIYSTCSKLGIPIPTCAEYMKPLHDKIIDDHFNKKKKNKN